MKLHFVSNEYKIVRVTVNGINVAKELLCGVFVRPLFLVSIHPNRDFREHCTRNFTEIFLEPR